MKKNKSIILLLIVIIFLSGCSTESSYFATTQKYYSNPADYFLVTQLSGYSQEYINSQKLFPINITKKENTTLFCRYDELFPLGEAFQILLEIHFDTKEEFNQERERITEISYECNNKFDFDSYEFRATRTDNSSYFEYTAIDSYELKIYYVYLQTVPRSEVEIDSKILPVDYEGIAFFSFTAINNTGNNMDIGTMC